MTLAFGAPAAKEKKLTELSSACADRFHHFVLADLPEITFGPHCKAETETDAEDSRPS